MLSTLLKILHIPFSWGSIPCAHQYFHKIKYFFKLSCFLMCYTNIYDYSHSVCWTHAQSHHLYSDDTGSRRRRSWEGPVCILLVRVLHHCLFSECLEKSWIPRCTNPITISFSLRCVSLDSVQNCSIHSACATSTAYSLSTGLVAEEQTSTCLSLDPIFLCPQSSKWECVSVWRQTDGGRASGCVCLLQQLESEPAQLHHCTK